METTAAAHRRSLRPGIRNARTNLSRVLHCLLRGWFLKLSLIILIIETTDPDELRRHVNSALGDNLLSVRDAANYVGVTTRTIKNWISSGTLEAKKYGSAFRIRKQDLERISDPQESRN